MAEPYLYPYHAFLTVVLSLPNWWKLVLGRQKKNLKNNKMVVALRTPQYINRQAGNLLCWNVIEGEGWSEEKNAWNSSLGEW